jgi:hypothetical protein
MTEGPKGRRRRVGPARPGRLGLTCRARLGLAGLGLAGLGLAGLGLAGLGLALQACAILFRDVKQDLIRVRSTVAAEIGITVADSFIETYKDRVTIDVSFDIDKIDLLPHPAFWDGDFHVAGRAPEVGLPVVAELENAASEREALAAIRAARKARRPLRLAGAWRIWAEHVGHAPEVQGQPQPPAATTDPNHVFEIHPVTRVEDRPVLDSLRPVAGYSPFKAAAAFKDFAGIPCKVLHDAATASTTIVTRKGATNDVEFLLEVGESPQRVVEDGRFVEAAALDLKGNRLAEKLRMVFVKDSPPEAAVQGLARGDRLHVFGLPRIDLAAVASRAERAAAATPEAAGLNLPYEILIVGVYGDAAPAAGSGGAPGVHARSRRRR